MKTKQFARKTITGGVACALLLGSFAGGSFTKQAFAAEAVQVSAASSTSPLISQHLNSIVRDTAWLADKDEAVIYAALQKGQNLAEASGLSVSDLTDKLTALLNQDVNYQFEDSDVSSSVVDSLKAEGASSIASAVSEKGFKPAAGVKAVDLDAIIQDQLNLVFSNAAVYADQELSDIEQRVQGGATLIQASGLSQSDLLSRLTTQLNQAIDNAATQQHIAPSVVQAAKVKGAQLLSDAISTEGYKPAGAAASVNVTSAVYEAVYGRINNIVVDATLIADKDYMDVTDALQAGGTLVQATGLSESGLYNSLVGLMDNDMNQAAKLVSISEEDLNQLKQEAHAQIQAIITTAGYTGTSNGQSADAFKAQVQNQLKLVVSEAATLADKELYEVEEAVAAGASLVNATGLNGSELIQKLTTSINQYIDANSAGMDADTVLKAKQDAAAYISNLVLSGTAE